MCIGSGIMLKTEMPRSDPTPEFATDAEVAFAQWLRHQLEQRYLGNSIGAAELAPSTEVH